MKIVISEAGKQELARLEYSIQDSLHKFLKYVPGRDIIKLSHILITDIPLLKLSREKRFLGSYFKMSKQRPAFIGIYLKNLFGHLSKDAFWQLFPIKEIGLAHVLFHEIGHHVEQIRSHGVKKNKKEHFADSYLEEAINNYIIDHADLVNSCFQNLESQPLSPELTLDNVKKMKSSWEKEHKRAITFYKKSL